ncbi:lysophospholipase L1-like esterase [Mucilaginibacter gracilis]|uniref:Lysophospholipase L1-like esterase n=1 Tax=Mucilaginibacter gracilis TaxID=423350 RepID=A0A495J0D2_9SPHI|nr:GDSL-type esterase/lipase family protein [Mucilaginibacter gracilis]RKR82435.1 lysophospholipase L1-like esterase [Mucilaginibacter gracilis]
MRRYLIIATSLLLLTNHVNAQSKHDYWDDVQTIKNFDKMYKAPAHPVLFVGSSSIRKWDDVEYTFAQYHALNRGIGGAVINDIIYYADDLIFNYKPRQIVLYVGENDVLSPINNGDTIFNRTLRLYKHIRAQMPGVPIVYISIKPSPSRQKYIQKVIDANKLIKAFLASEKNVVYVNIFDKMVDKEGKPQPELFVADMLHMNRDGYDIWKKAIKPHLLKE